MEVFYLHVYSLAIKSISFHLQHALAVVDGATGGRNYWSSQLFKYLFWCRVNWRHFRRDCKPFRVPNPVIGASGAVYGVMVAFAMLITERQ